VPLSGGRAELNLYEIGRSEQGEAESQNGCAAKSHHSTPPAVSQLTGRFQSTDRSTDISIDPQSGRAIRSPRPFKDGLTMNAGSSWRRNPFHINRPGLAMVNACDRASEGGGVVGIERRLRAFDISAANSACPSPGLAIPDGRTQDDAGEQFINARLSVEL